MNNKKRDLYIAILLILVAYTNLLSIKITSLYKTLHEDKEYEKLKLGIKDYYIDYCTIYTKDFPFQYKVYKINNSYKGGSMDKIKTRLENSDVWSRKKFYEYKMMRFYEKIDGETTKLDREDLYYYNEGQIYAIIDVKNTKLYYLKDSVLKRHDDYDELLGIDLSNYIDLEIYEAKGNHPQNDGIDYYTYKFDEEKGKEIKEVLNKSQNWSTEKLDIKVLDDFEYNSEVLSIQNGYYYYETVYETNNSYKNIEIEERGYEVGVYDCDTNIFYYYLWRH